MRRLLLCLSLMLCVLSAFADEAKRDSARMEVERLHRLKDSLYNKAAAEAQAKYNAELGNDQLQEDSRVVSRTRTYILFGSILLLAVGCCFLVRQRRLIALQKKRLSEDTKTLEELQLQYGHQQQDGTAHAEAHELSEQDKQFLSKAMTIIANQIETNSVNVDDLASELAMSTSQFRRRLSAITGETPQGYITNIRMQKARHLLDTNSDMTILDVAKGCGYDDQSSFTRAFKRFFGVTPSDYLAKVLLCLLLFTATMTVGAAPKSDGKPTVSRQEAIRLYEASGRYYEEQLYDSAVIVGEQALPMLRQLNMTDEIADELSILAVCTSRQSPSVAASVRMRVVSWKDAAEMKLSVSREALVMPSRTGSASAGFPPAAATRLFSRSNS